MNDSRLNNAACNHFYCDFHIHIGKSLGRPVKMAAASTLTLENLLVHARNFKGLDVVTIIDAATTNVIRELDILVQDGRLALLPGGGYRFENGLVVFLGSEIEIAGPYGGAAHFGAWFGNLDAAHDFVGWLSTVQKNPSLSSQKAFTNAETLQSQVVGRDGLFIVHHAFTPHKGMYGNCVPSMSEMLNPAEVDALELGLSADTGMADCLAELENVTFITNSDAHSLPKIAREYNEVRMDSADFESVRKAFRRKDDHRVAANYGLHTQLGKYHRTSCLDCGRLWDANEPVCTCGSKRKVAGVYDRLCEIRDVDTPKHPSHRPPYVHQVPLEFIPGLGGKTYKRLLDAFGTEMNVLHRATSSELAEVVGQAMSEKIDAARSGHVDFSSGGAGYYGKVIL